MVLVQNRLEIFEELDRETKITQSESVIKLDDLNSRIGNENRVIEDKTGKFGENCVPNYNYKRLIDFHM